MMSLRELVDSLAVPGRHYANTMLEVDSMSNDVICFSERFE